MQKEKRLQIFLKPENKLENTRWKVIITVHRNLQLTTAGNKALIRTVVLAFWSTMYIRQYRRIGMGFVLSFPSQKAQVLTYDDPKNVLSIL